MKNLLVIPLNDLNVLACNSHKEIAAICYYEVLEFWKYITYPNNLNVFPVGLKYIHKYNLLCLHNKYFLMNSTIW